MPVVRSITLSAGEPGGSSLHCILLGDCSEVVADISDVPAGSYTVRAAAWRSDLLVDVDISRITLDGQPTTIGTGFFASHRSDEVQVDLIDASKGVVATSGRVPW